MLGESPLEAADHAGRHAQQRGVEDRGVLPLQQAERADLVAERDREVGAELGLQDLPGADLVLGGRRAEGAGDRDRAAPRPDRLGGQALDRLGVQRGDLLAVVLVAALDDGGRADDPGADVIGPGGAGADPQRGGGGEPQHGHPVQAAPLDDGVGRMRGPQHRLGDPRVLQPHQHPVEGRSDAVDGLGGGGHLHRRQHLSGGVDHDRVGVRAAHVDADAEIPGVARRTHRGSSTKSTSS